MKYYFGDNREYGAEDIKKALGVLVADGGIELGLSDGKEHSPSELNRIIAAAAARGVVTESNDCLKLVKRPEGYFIRPGKAVFSDGGIVEVEEEAKVEISGGYYLYIAYDEMLDQVYFLMEKTEKTEGEGHLLIPIAYVENGGDVRDMRVFARSKLPAPPTATWNVLREVEMVIDPSTITYGDLIKANYVEAKHPIDGDINFMLVESDHYISTMYIGDKGAAYHFVMGAGRSSYGSFNDYIAVDYMGGNGPVKATLLETGPDYIKMRYAFPRAVSGGSFSYRALIGIKN